MMKKKIMIASASIMATVAMVYVAMIVLSVELLKEGDGGDSLPPSWKE